MDIITTINAVSSGGPTALFLILAALIYGQFHIHKDLKRRVDEVSDSFMEFQLHCAENRVKNEDIDELKRMIDNVSKTNLELVSKLIVRIDSRSDEYVYHQRREDLGREFRRAGRPDRGDEVNSNYEK
ncbi:MAG: hypothetical protein HQL75_00420 [Magnetococcales bacterium]|nr:hypothetical protein [Magnetococcales bacterium]